uniref:Uncharacterized protein n=1 Tax=Salix viminalis TaxID=40686 RepID=A0A6N2KQB7_SALVM
MNKHLTSDVAQFPILTSLLFGHPHYLAHHFRSLTPSFNASSFPAGNQTKQKTAVSLRILAFLFCLKLLFEACFPVELDSICDT